MNTPNTLLRAIHRMDTEMIPYTAETLKPRKALVEKLNEIGYTVGIGYKHKVVLKTLPKENPLPVWRTNF